MALRTCVDRNGKFIYGLHKPSYRVKNLRRNDYLSTLGKFTSGDFYDNRRNFPTGDITVESADWVYEIPNPFPFKGTTFINKAWADQKALDPESIALPRPEQTSLSDALKKLLESDSIEPATLNKAIECLPNSLLLALAKTSTDAEELKHLARHCCTFIFTEDCEQPSGLLYEKDRNGKTRAAISNHDLFETLVNNVCLPDEYKEVMVLRPGVQGGSEIVGEQGSAAENNHVFEYLRSNSYIPWGHYAANMANDSIRYKIEDLTAADMAGMRHLYYQRTFVRVAEQLNLPLPAERKTISPHELERLRLQIIKKLSASPALQLNSTLWGWNYGFDFSPSGYRLHASHQQIHQQFAMLPATIPAWHGHDQPAESTIRSFGCGDMVADFCREYREETGRSFFETYIKAIRCNRRMDEKKNGAHSLIIHEDENVMLFVPKAQTSQWELQIMTLKQVGNILEADTATRKSLDNTLLIAQKILAAMGACMVTSVEYPKRFDSADADQRLLCALLPKLPNSMGGFSEAQLRWINGHYPEDFAAACRARMQQASSY